ncbi:hypothetical protein BaRGS_00018129 [Batillaria attramentaria]|uniref:Uncharacterized protein n=1 Tax=Batillaria attramentaria TaxID=370345 RepID=A0ABD0KU35_9CAEN
MGERVAPARSSSCASMAFPKTSGAFLTTVRRRLWRMLNRSFLKTARKGPWRLSLGKSLYPSVRSAGSPASPCHAPPAATTADRTSRRTDHLQKRPAGK